MSDGEVVSQTSTDTIDFEKKRQEEHRCKHPRHSTYHVREDFTCPKAHKCPNIHEEGCIAK